MQYNLKRLDEMSKIIPFKLEKDAQKKHGAAQLSCLSDRMQFKC